MKTQAEVVARLKERANKDVLGFETSEYLNALDFEHAREFLREATTAELYEAAGFHRFKSDADVLQQMQGYLDFAYSKIRDERGISATRSVQHYVAWLWLVGNDELSTWVDHEQNTNWHGYGRHIIDRVANHYGWQNEPSPKLPYTGPKYHETMADVYAAFVRESGGEDSPEMQERFNETAHRFQTGQFAFVQARK